MPSQQSFNEVITYGRYKGITIRSLVEVKYSLRDHVKVNGYRHGKYEVRSYIEWSGNHKHRFSNFHQVHAILACDSILQTECIEAAKIKKPFSPRPPPPPSPPTQEVFGSKLSPKSWVKIEEGYNADLPKHLRQSITTKYDTLLDQITILVGEVEITVSNPGKVTSE